MAWWVWPLLALYFFICFLLMGVILIQSGKGGGLSSLGSAAGGISDALGATGAEKTLNKITTGIAVGFMVLAIFLSIFGARSSGTKASDIFKDKPAATTAPAAPGGAATQQAPLELPQGAPASADPLPVAPAPAAPQQ